MWAWASVTIAFGARVTAADRGLALDVWQRPSRGRAGDVEIIEWSQRPLRFGGAQHPASITEVLPGSTVSEHEWPVQLITKSLVAADAVTRDAVGTDEVPVILVIRLGGQSWGPLPEAPAEPNPATPLAMTLEDAAGLTSDGAFDTDIHELRVLPPAGGKLFPWAAYPALASKAATWISERAVEFGSRPILIGAILPPEIALGLGIEAARPTGPIWPGHLWPIVARPPSSNLVVPRLNLGVVAHSPSNQLGASS
jgi:hypothetical protein